ncbi:hypothetical protein [Extibacter muris]|nr:hypothetical protein [Extibacter muris]MCU0080537.1 hypothetical protein [Extibacter muris]
MLPLTQGIKLMKEISMGGPLEDTAGIVALLAAITIICCCITKCTFRWE